MDRTSTHWDYASILRDAWSLLESGAADAAAGMHYPVLATRGLDDVPNARALLLWRVARGDRLLYFATDGRSPKHAELARAPWAFLVFYESSAQTQLRVRVRVRFRQDDALTREAWRETPLHTRRVFATPAPPGSVAQVPEAGPPVQTMHDSGAADEAGYRNFELLEAKVAHLDWLYMPPSGHRRAAFTWVSADEPEARWLYP
jgi:pyridoxamine 5'-phosphate oxidase